MSILLTGAGRSGVGNMTVSPPDIPVPTYYFLPQANGTRSNITGNLAMLGFGANVPIPTTGLRGCVSTYAGNGCRTVHVAGCLPNANTSTLTIATSARADATASMVLESEIAPGSGTFTLFCPGDGTISAGVTLANGSFISVTTAFTPFCWHEVTLQRDAVSGNLTVNVDGAYSASVLTATGPLQNAAGNYTEGSHVDRSSTWNGNQGATAIWIGNAGQPTWSQLLVKNQYGQDRLLMPDGTWSANDTTLFPLGRLANMVESVPGRKVILDMDPGEDPGDMKGLFLGIYYDHIGNVSLQGVVVTTTLDKAAVITRLMLNQAGLTTKPVYAYQDGIPVLSTINDNYATAVATAQGNTTGRASFQSSTAGYSAMLNAVADGELTVIFQGFAAGANQFIQSSAGNKTLWNQKVGLMVIAAGVVPSGAAEYNFFQDSANWTQLLGNATCCKVYSPLAFGSIGNTGVTIGNLAANQVLRQTNSAFFNSGNVSGNASGNRAFWDEAPWKIVGEGLRTNAKFGDPDITNSVNPSNGCNTWTKTSGNDTFLQPVKPGSVYVIEIDSKTANLPLVP